MKFYFAPMEGITGYIHRNAHHEVFGGIDKYFTAFISPNQHGKLSSKEKNDILPEHNVGVCTVPQMLTNNAADFILTAERLQEYGYREVNLNLGCPSKTVVSKYRGSGFLAKPAELDAFLEEVFDRVSIDISIKTRIGRDAPQEFYNLMDIYNRYPLKELIIHPRTQQDFYKNHPNMEMFKEAVRKCRHPLCYNGDLFTGMDFENWEKSFPNVDAVMIGRGLLINPGMVGGITGTETVTKERIRRFHDKVYEGYRNVLSGDKNVLFKMKELWCYMGHLFADGKQQVKKIKKAESCAVYEERVTMLFEECRLIENDAQLYKQ